MFPSDTWCIGVFFIEETDMSLSILNAEQTAPKRKSWKALLVIPLAAVIAVALIAHQQRHQSARMTAEQKAERAALVTMSDAVKKLQKDDAVTHGMDKYAEFQQRCARYAGPWPKNEPIPSVSCRGKSYRQ
jgi:hypothetical protein